MSSIGSTFAIAPLGIDGFPVRVEVHVTSGLPAFHLVGLADTSLKERVKAAMSHSGIEWHYARYTVSLSPADVPKAGSAFDLPIAAAIMAAGCPEVAPRIATTVHMGELGLDGSIRRVRGILSLVLAARDAGFARVVVPYSAQSEACLVPNIEVIPVKHIVDLARLYGIPTTHTPPVSPPLPARHDPETVAPHIDMKDVRGQYEARHALEVAAAGGHHLLLIGAAGTGKTMLAERLPTILPPLEAEESLQATAIHSLAGTLDHVSHLMKTRPWVAPHHSVSMPALIGGGSALIMPGAISLAHAGVLFLDEAPEFSPHVLDSLRQPLEAGSVTIQRMRSYATFPARFQLVLAANPCPCGAGSDDPSCTCTPYQRHKYRSRLSGPLLDRIDITCHVNAPRLGSLRLHGEAEDSASIKKRVIEARKRQKHRWRKYPWSTNSAIPSSYLHEHSPLSSTQSARLIKAVETGILTLRGVDRVMRVAWTLADLAGHSTPCDDDITTAFNLRTYEGENA